jgi:hypothetical protein
VCRIDLVGGATVEGDFIVASLAFRESSRVFRFGRPEHITFAFLLWASPSFLGCAGNLKRSGEGPWERAFAGCL